MTIIHSLIRITALTVIIIQQVTLLNAQSGCTDVLACNFDPNAVINDGSCIYIVDCGGVCGGNYVQDACGNCYDPNAQGGNFTETFNYTGAPQTFIVPAGVNSVHIETWGASGWTGSYPGGDGGYSYGDLAVSPGQALYIYVGGQGTVANGSYIPAGGGWNGGGNGQSNGGSNVVGGGGGASDVRLVYNANPLDAASLNSRVIVAGGGGGSTNNGNAYGGDGGGATGQNGGQHASYHYGRCGSQIAGGDNGGGFGFGGNAQNWMTPWNGGGGGGWYGGGVSTAHSGGGGGSSYIGGVVNGVMQQAGRVGNGLVVISYSTPAIPNCLPGCTDYNADNYNANATFDDGSCLYDLGCTDLNACNYDPSAGNDDGSCLYLDCAGICGGSYVQDACGNCYDPNAQGGNFSETFNFTGAPQTFTVPAGVNSVHIETWGASGWSGSYPGGDGGYSYGDLAVSPGQSLYIYVGGQGTVANGYYIQTGGGWNGGGNGQSNGANNAVGGGGGASDVRLVYNANPLDAASLNSRVIVAGGGGGSTNNGNAYGGDGGGATGQDGGQHSGYHYGRGGSPIAGGDNGGGFGFGGNAQNWMTPWNGGGGGGWYGGGVSTAHSGGGGGSSYIGGVVNGSMQQAGRVGHGLVVISYNLPVIPECYPGCTDPMAENYDAQANFDDGSCSFPGCTDPNASNYDANANSDNGTCLYPGCTDPIASNYDPGANMDDGTCTYPGCTDPIADNYDMNANIDDGSCIYSGCTNPLAINYNPQANNDDGTCIIPGCTYALAMNYNPFANDDDGSCIFVQSGCTDPSACNFNPCATSDDGSCFGNCNGCTYPDASNFNPAATNDDGSCEFGCPEDITNDGVVNTADLLEILGSFGTICN
jgi:hypothetical protein